MNVILKRSFLITSMVLIVMSMTVFLGCTSEPENTEPFKFGMILVGPKNDKGWSQAHYEGGKYLEEKLKTEPMIVMDKINPADSPDITVEQVVDDMVASGAKLIIATSDDMKDGILTAAAKHTSVPIVHISGDSAWEEGKTYRSDLTLLSNVMGQMEYGKMIAGCAAALKTETGKIGFLGPLINDETRRLANAAYLGAKHCWTVNKGKNIADLSFKVTWIGFWFHIPGFTIDPTQVTNGFFDSGIDVVISGIDTTEALVVAGQRAQKGDKVWAVPYDYEGACEQAPTICLGVPYFNWGPSYVDIAESVKNNSYKSSWTWVGPDWKDINNKDKSAIGFMPGEGLTQVERKQINAFISDLGKGKIKLFTGPLNYQDGTKYLDNGETASNKAIWYTPQLLEGMEGNSSAE